MVKKGGIWLFELFFTWIDWRLLPYRFSEKLAYGQDKDQDGRIDMRIMKTGNNFWNTGHTTASTFGLRTHSMQPKVKVAPFTRLNQTKSNMKQMQGFVSDGTALNMGDPNSMRDQGQTRNAVYNGAIKYNSHKSERSVPYKTFLRRDGAQNQSFYSFGGSKMIREETEGRGHLLNPAFKDYDGKVVSRDVITYSKDYNKRVTDYTKNVSQSIFSPGELQDYGYVTKQSQLNVWRNKMRKGEKSEPRRDLRTRAGSAAPGSHRQLERFARNLNEEAKKKQKLREQLDEIKSAMSQY